MCVCLVPQWQIITITLLTIQFRCQCRLSVFCLLWDFFILLGISVCSEQAVSSWFVRVMRRIWVRVMEGFWGKLSPISTYQIVSLLSTGQWSKHQTNLLLNCTKRSLTGHLNTNSCHCTFENTGVISCLNRVSIFHGKAKGAGLGVWVVCVCVWGGDMMETLCWASL